MMSEIEIKALKAKVAEGGVYWKSLDGECLPVSSVNLNWVEFEDQPELTEPAAMISGGGAIALNNVDASEFVILMPALGE